MNTGITGPELKQCVSYLLECDENYSTFDTDGDRESALDILNDDLTACSSWVDHYMERFVNGTDYDEDYFDYFSDESMMLLDDIHRYITGWELFAISYDVLVAEVES